jgi:hypothetical protein
MKKNKNEPRIIKILGKNVKESLLQATFKEVLKKRGVIAELVVKGKPQSKKSIEQLNTLRRRKAVEYANVYKYAFF